MNDLTYDITDKDVLWVQEQYSSKFSIELDTEAAFRKLQLLVRQMHVLYQPVTKEQARLINEEQTNDTPRTAADN